jgi:Tol biopolymer transport system component
MPEDLQSRLRGVDVVEPPDLWDAITVRSERPGPAPRGPRLVAAAVGLALAVAVVAGMLWALNREHPSVVPAVQPGVNGAIVWTGAIADTDSPADVGVRAADPGSGAVIRVTNPAGARDSELTWSADGTRSAFLRAYVDAGQIESADLVVRDLDGTEHVVVHCPGADPSCLPAPGFVLSPDGSRLALARSVADRGLMLEVLDVATGDTTKICDAITCGPMAELVWSPDGSRIAFSHVASDRDVSEVVDRPDNGIWVASADGSSARLLTHPDVLTCAIGAHECSFDSGPSWSPNGSAIAFVRTSAERSVSGLALVDPDTGKITPEADCVPICPPAAVPVWSPDGRRLAVMSVENPRRAVPAILMMNLQQGDTSFVHVCDECRPETVLWSPDGRQLAFASSGNLYVESPDGNDLHRVSTAVPLEAIEWLPAGAVTFPSS